MGDPAASAEGAVDPHTEPKPEAPRMQDRKGHGTSGMSHFADVANPVKHYPVKQRREPRRLDPNWAGIAWLEAQSLEDTEIIGRANQGEGIRFLRASGWHWARARGAYPGPMFRIVHDQPLDPGAVVCDDPCPDCDDFSRTSRCSTHPEKRAEEWIISQMTAPRTSTPTPTLTVHVDDLVSGSVHQFIAEQLAHRLAGRHQAVLDGVEVTYEEARDA